MKKHDVKGYFGGFMFGCKNDIRKETEKDNINEPCFGGFGGRLAYEIFRAQKGKGRFSRLVPKIATTFLFCVFFGALGTLCGMMMFNILQGGAFLQYSGNNEKIPHIADSLNESPTELSASSLGADVVDITKDHAERYRVPMGVLIRKISEECIGYEAGVRGGDILVMFDGVSVSGIKELDLLADSYESGKSVPVRVFRDGEYCDFTITIE